METLIAPAFDRAVAPLCPYLLPITRNLPEPIDDFVLSLLGKPCHGALLLDLRFSNNHPEHACFSLLVSKSLGLLIIGVSAIVKVPQILKLLTSRSSEGLSFLSCALETASFLISLAYSARSGFPFSTYGETALIAAQDVVIGALVLHFAGRDAAAAVFVAGLAAAVYALFFGGDNDAIVSMDLLTYLQAGAGLLSVASKAPQIWTVWSEGGTGQLSAFAVFNYLGGSLSRIFTTLQEVDDKLILYGFVAGFTLNAILALQMIYYWNTPASSTTTPAGGEKARKKKSQASGSSDTTKKPKTPSTRRRG